MNHNNQIWTIIMFTVLFYGSVQAQAVKTKADVRSMFPVETRDLWINYLSGTLDGKHVVDMIIGTDGHTCKGLYTMRSSGITFMFEGHEIDKQLKLVELNSDFKTTGFLFGNYDGQKFDGLWMNVNRNLRLPFNLIYVNSFEDFRPLNNGYHNWIQHYSGKINNEQCTLSIIRENDVYTCIVKQNNVRYKDIMPAKEGRVIMLELNFPLTVLNKKWAVIDTLNLDKIDIMHLDENGYEILTPFKRDAGLVLIVMNILIISPGWIVSGPFQGIKNLIFGWKALSGTG
ncbi:MAG: hypothetical protein IPO92_02910 [Saprospiraceae bacterium]|nr:hypothetical protein [Saprospiraceae bacterium]